MPVDSLQSRAPRINKFFIDHPGISAPVAGRGMAVEKDACFITLTSI